MQDNSTGILKGQETVPTVASQDQEKGFKTYTDRPLRWHSLEVMCDVVREIEVSVKHKTKSFHTVTGGLLLVHCRLCSRSRQTVE